MDALSMEVFLSAITTMVWCVRVKSEPICDQTQFFHPNGTCVPCPVCGPGQELSKDCGFGDGGEGVCLRCEEGKFSVDTGVSPCVRCTQCNLLNRLEKTACSPTSDAQCGQCLPRYYELRSMTGQVELSCVPCYSHDTVHKECLRLTAQVTKGESAVTAPGRNFKEPEEKKVKEETFSMVLIGSATASSIFLIALVLWAFLLTAERFKQVPDYCSGPERLLSTNDLQLSTATERVTTQSEAPSQTFAAPQDPLRGQNALSQENEVHPASIVINVTTNIKPSSQKEENNSQGEQKNSSFSMEEMEQKLQAIWEVAQGQSIEMLDYDSVQDLSLLLDSADNKDNLRWLGRSLGVPPQVITHLPCFQDLFQYLRTSTYTLLPQLAQAAALLPNPEVVARIHRAVVTT